MPKRTRRSKLDDVDGEPPKKAKVSTVEEGESKTDWGEIKWDDLGSTADGRPWNRKFSTWNVNGVRAWLKNGGLEYVRQESPDIFTMQETKCSEDELPVAQLNVEGYHAYWHSAEKKGYSGVGLYSKEKPISVTKGIGMDKYDCEGRLITAEYPDFFFLTSYVPNAGEGLKRLSFKKEWDVDLRNYMKKLDQTKPVILCGDLNVAHLNIDLKNPKTNHKTAGFTPEEREDFTLLLNEGFVDVFRHLYPDKLHAYTYWSYRFNARAKDTGWRLDYFVVSKRLLEDVCDCVIRKSVLGSDHCPLVLSLATPSTSAASAVEPVADTATPTTPPLPSTADSSECSATANGSVTSNPPTSTEDTSTTIAPASDDAPSDEVANIAAAAMPAPVSNDASQRDDGDGKNGAAADESTPAAVRSEQ